MSDLTFKKERTPTCSVQRFGAFQHQVIGELVRTYPAAQTMRWRNAVYDAFKDLEEVQVVEEDFRGLLDDLGFIPDAFVVDKEDARVDFFEVEVTSPMSLDKLQGYAKFVTDLDYYGITFEVYTVNQHGHINRVDLVPHYGAWLMEASGAY